MPPVIDPRPARVLTSREAAKVISAQMSALVSLCEPGALGVVIEHFAEHRDHYVEMFKAVEVQVEAVETAIAAASSGAARA